VLLAITFTSLIGYHLFLIEYGTQCYYSSSTKEVFSKFTDAQQTINVSRRFTIILGMLFVYHLIDGFRSICALLYIFTLQKNHWQKACENGDYVYDYYLNDSEDESDIKGGMAEYLEMFYSRLVFNEFIFIIGFTLLHMFRLSDSGDACSK
jgi:hypothetical protein